MSTKIQWADDTWNPVVGCEIAGAGCTNCYAMRAAHVRAGNPRTPHYAGTTRVVNGNPVWTGKVGIARPQTWDRPLRTRRPTVFFVDSMGDLFFTGVSRALRDRAYAVMAASPQHVFIVLTKRPEEARAYHNEDRPRPFLYGQPWPLPNVWLGVSIWDQTSANAWVPILLGTRAARRIVSVEPMIGPVELDNLWLPRPIDDTVKIDALTGEGFRYDGLGPLRRSEQGASLDGMIVGGESGSGARPCLEGWVRDLLRQGAEAGTPVFVKQLGTVWARANGAADKAGGDPSEWPADLRVRQWPPFSIAGSVPPAGAG